MAIFFRGMTNDEVFTLTREMRDSGIVLDLSSISARKIDKHSTGGVGDKTSLLLAPIAAACGVVVPMITGRSLGHAGGTLDKLRSIPGFDPHPSKQEIMKALSSVGAVIMGQTRELAPADRRLYSLRDVTATVESIPLITASILSKKLAEGIDGLVMDITTGSGAYMTTRKQAMALARMIVSICRKMQTDIVVLVTDMEQPRGRAVGNAIEVRECIEFLNGNAPEDLETVTLTLAAHMIRLAGKAKSLKQGMKLAYEAVSKGEARKRFGEIIQAQHGDPRVLDNPDLLPKAGNVSSIRAKESGYIVRADAKLLGTGSNALGAGRLRVDDEVDPSVGLYLHKKVGDRVAAGDVICDIHWNDKDRFSAALPLIQDAFSVGRRLVRPSPLIHAVLEG
jgi:pyrimidine-nucleoside phosphorylase